jgi:histidine triad (HIT) family protein
MASKDCIFCKIAGGEVPAEFERETKNVVVFPDMNPSAQIHLLIVPKKHIGEYADISGDDKKVWDEMNDIAHDLIVRRKLGTKGYRIVMNGGSAAMVPHLHMHLLGGIDAKRRI